MATFDDLAIEQKLTVYDKGFDQQGFEGYGEYIARSGDVWSPQIPNEEPLRIECRHFVERVLNGAGRDRTGWRVCVWCACSRRSRGRWTRHL
jgi:hypothetical protein